MLRGVLRKIKSQNLCPTIDILNYYETAQEALAEEVRLIAFYGRRDLGTGSLCNMTNGGDGAVNLSNDTEAKRKKAVREALKRPEVLAKISQASKDNWNNQAYRANIAEKIALFSNSAVGTILRSSAAKSRWATKDAKERFKDAVLKRWEGGAKESHSSLMKCKWEQPQYRSAIITKRLETHRTEAYRAAQSARAKASWAARKLKQEALL